MILVTGGTGLVGSHLLWHLIQRGEKVRAVHRPGSDLRGVKEVFGYYPDPSGEKNGCSGNSLSGRMVPFEKGNVEHPETGNEAFPEKGNVEHPETGNEAFPEKGNVDPPETGDKSSPEAGSLPAGKETGSSRKGYKKIRPGSPAGTTAEGDIADEFFGRIEWVVADMLDPLSLNEAMEGIDKVYHCAAIVSFDPLERKKTIKNNIESTATLVNLCLEHKVEKLCHVSSVSALGRRYDGEPVTEDDLWRPSKRRNAYSISKFHSEMEVWRGIAEGLNAVIVNPSVILGPGNWTRGSAGFFTSVQKGMKYYTEGMTGFVDVRDVCRCMIALMDSDISGERFILNGENLYYRDLLNMIADALGKSRPDTHATKALTEIGWRLEWLRSRLTFSKPRLTRSTARSGRSINRYSSQKIRQTLGHEFIPVEETVSWTASKLPEKQTP